MAGDGSGCTAGKKRKEMARIMNYVCTIVQHRYQGEHVCVGEQL